MREPMLILAAVAALAAVISGILGFVVYPAQARRHQGHARSTRRRGGRRGGNKRSDEALPPRQGLARALFIVFAAAAFVALFFGMLM